MSDSISGINNQNNPVNDSNKNVKSTSVWTSSEDSIFLNKHAANNFDKTDMDFEDYENLNATLCNGHSDYYTKKDNSTKEKLTHSQKNELEKTANEVIKQPNLINMKNVAVALKLVDDSRDSGKDRNAAKVQVIINNVIAHSQNYNAARLFDGTDKNPQPPELVGVINPENAQKYFNSQAGKNALSELGVTNIKTQNNQTTAEINGQLCKLEMNVNGTLRFSFIKENGATSAIEFNLKQKPVLAEQITNQNIEKGKAVKYTKTKDSNGAALGDARSKEANNLESSTAKRFDEKNSRTLFKKLEDELGINIDDYEFIQGNNPCFKKKDSNEFVSINNQGQVIVTTVKETSNKDEYEFNSQEYKVNLQNLLN